MHLQKKKKNAPPPTPPGNFWFPQPACLLFDHRRPYREAFLSANPTYLYKSCQSFYSRASWGNKSKQLKRKPTQAISTKLRCLFSS